MVILPLLFYSMVLSVIRAPSPLYILHLMVTLPKPYLLSVFFRSASANLSEISSVDRLRKKSRSDPMYVFLRRP